MGLTGRVLEPEVLRGDSGHGIVLIGDISKRGKLQLWCKQHSNWRVTTTYGGINKICPILIAHARKAKDNGSNGDTGVEIH